MGPVAAVRAALSAGDTSGGHHAGARHRLSRNLGPSDPQGRLDARERGDRSRDPDPAVRQRAQSQRALPFARARFTLQTLPAEPEGSRRKAAESSGFSLHAGIAAKASQRDKLEHLARYVSRPAVAIERLSLTEGGYMRCALKTPYRDGTTHVIFEPEDFIARLAALVPKPRAHLTRYHGVFAPASPDRAQVVPGTHAAANKAHERGEASGTDRRRALMWAQRLKRVFAIDIEVCRRCGGRLRVIASIDDPAVIERILGHLGRDADSAPLAPPSRAPPDGDLSP
jgi:hypothetical protein